MTTYQEQVASQMKLRKAKSIVLALAAQPEPVRMDALICLLCGGMTFGGVCRHKPECPWLQAREYVESE